MPSRSCRATSASSWTATAGGRSSAASRGSKATAPAPRASATSRARRASSGIEALTLYAFSSQNWARPADEVAGLMELLREFLIDERAEILDNGIRLEALGDIERLPALVREPLDELRAASAQQFQAWC